MNNWWKAGLLGAGALGLSALTGGAAAGPLAGLLGSTGEAGAVAGGAALTGEGAAAATTAAEAGTAAAASPTAFVTPAVTGAMAPSATAGSAALDAIAASQPGYVAGNAGLDAVAASQPGYAAGGQALNGMKAGSTLGSMGKAASAYGTVQQGIGMGSQPQARAPAPHSIFQGDAPPIAQSMAPPSARDFIANTAMNAIRKHAGGGLFGNSAAQAATSPGLMAPQGNQFAQMLLDQRQRGMLG